ncbi:uncharacterized protein PV09_08040 [Verruconis gallopava]|uniref:Uncharacterized protein n=1 Tax=Verruconis gallopava TaxID=253628 RepID=A0A0D1YHJ8_9PEZI|nr:uncharacterized protein PV09_08040 [Verruconis gallopava]KIW00327.1 hypothetical protein PV09_08040 [Verruconis gallopava]
MGAIKSQKLVACRKCTIFQGTRSELAHHQKVHHYIARKPKPKSPSISPRLDRFFDDQFHSLFIKSPTISNSITKGLDLPAAARDAAPLQESPLSALAQVYSQVPAECGEQLDPTPQEDYISCFVDLEPKESAPWPSSDGERLFSPVPSLIPDIETYSEQQLVPFTGLPPTSRSDPRPETISQNISSINNPAGNRHLMVEFEPDSVLEQTIPETHHPTVDHAETLPKFLSSVEPQLRDLRHAPHTIASDAHTDHCHEHKNEIEVLRDEIGFLRELIMQNMRSVDARMEQHNHELAQTAVHHDRYYGAILSGLESFDAHVINCIKFHEKAVPIQRVEAIEGHCAQMNSDCVERYEKAATVQSLNALEERCNQRMSNLQREYQEYSQSVKHTLETGIAELENGVKTSGFLDSAERTSLRSKCQELSEKLRCLDAKYTALETDVQSARATLEGRLSEFEAQIETLQSSVARVRASQVESQNEVRTIQKSQSRLVESASLKMESVDAELARRNRDGENITKLAGSMRVAACRLKMVEDFLNRQFPSSFNVPMLAKTAER